MITNWKISVDLTEDWRKIIRVLEDGQASMAEIVNRTGISKRKAISIIKTMKILYMVDNLPELKIRMGDKK